MDKMLNSSDMPMRERYLQKLETLYQDLEVQLGPAEGNPCGSCRACCTRKGISQHSVTVLELELIRERVGPAKLEDFLQFLRRDGELELCPYFDESLWGCGIYPNRPFSCRVFGHHRREDTRLPEVCVFSGQEAVFGVGEYLERVPRARDLKELSRAFWPYQRQYFGQVEGGVGEASSSLKTEGDALDQALAFMNEDRYDEALRTFEESDLPSTPYVLFCLSLVFEALERHSDARLALNVALEQAPECVPLWFRLGCNLTSLGDRDAAKEAFTKTVRLDPDHALGHAFLGSSALSLGRHHEAAIHLTRSLKLEKNSSVESWLQQALQGLGVV